MLAKFSGLNPKGPYLSLELLCTVFTYPVKRASEIRKFQVVVVQRLLKNGQKSVRHVQSCCFTDINLLLFLPFSLPSPSLLLELAFVVIQKFCYRGNVTSHFSLFPVYIKKQWLGTAIVRLKDELLAKLWVGMGDAQEIIATVVSSSCSSCSLRCHSRSFLLRSF